MAKLLGICIPTRNRPDDLKKCIEAFIPQVKPYKYPIFISDNSDNNETRDIIRSLKNSEYNLIFYSKNKGKKTYAPNAINSLKMANTEYIWLFGDDDLVKKDAIERITKELKRGMQFIQVNCSLRSLKLNKIVAERRLPMTHNILYGEDDNNKVLLNAKAGHAGNMSQLIVNRKDALRVLSFLPDKAKNNSFIHTILFYGAIVGKRGIMLAEPLMDYQIGTTRGDKHIGYWAREYPDALSNLANVSPGYTIEARQEELRQSRRNVRASIFLARRDYPESADAHLDMIMKDTDLTLKEKLFGLMLFIIPYPLIKAMDNIVTERYHKKKYSIQAKQ